MVLEARIPVISIKAKRLPISPPFNLSKFDLIKSIDKKTIVAFREEVFKKVNGQKGLTISLTKYNLFDSKINFKNAKKDSNESLKIYKIL